MNLFDTKPCPRRRAGVWPLVLLVSATSAIWMLPTLDQAHAQSRFSLPNPLIKPAKGSESREDGAPQNGQGGPASSVPSGAPPLPVVSKIDPNTREPVDGAAGGVPGAAGSGGSGRPGSAGGGGGKGSEVADSLLQYTVTAVVGDRATLRTQVGAVTGAGASGAQPQGQGLSAVAAGPAGGGAPGASAPKSRVLRVRTGEAIVVGGARLMPRVNGSSVEFFTESGEAVASVLMESMTPVPAALAQSAKEPLDPAMTARVTPSTGPRNASTAGTVGGAGSPVGGGGAAGTPSIGGAPGGFPGTIGR